MYISEIISNTQKCILKADEEKAKLLKKLMSDSSFSAEHKIYLSKLIHPLVDAIAEAVVSIRPPVKQHNNRVLYKKITDKITNRNPSNYIGHPKSSITSLCETESVAKNIMMLLSEKGNVFRAVSFKEYSERFIDDDTEDYKIDAEKNWFDEVINHCISSAAADNFCHTWFTPGHTDN
jgi:hypothetical protein